MNDYEVVIGLEVHAELLTESKAFCGCSATFGAEPNTQVCPVCLGMPGVLPVLNEKVLEYCLRTAIALDCEIAPYSKFDRKNYYYPDLPKNYQISQYDLPLARKGYIEVTADGATRRIGIRRVHLEEDAGKLLHVGLAGAGGYSLVDFNRAGVPLLEIVSEPDIRSPAEAREYMQALRDILHYLEVSDCKMEEGSLRCDVNVSLRARGSQHLGIRAEVKNLNSFRALERCLEYEIARQSALLARGEIVEQETRRWDEARGVTEPLRTKEETQDYRYFPDPDLVPVVISPERIEEIRRRLPELPGARKERFVREYDLPVYDAAVLTSSRRIADYYEQCARAYPDPKVVSNWVMGELLKELNARGLGIEECPVSPGDLVGLLELVDKGTISGKMAKDVFGEMFASGKAAAHIVQEKGLLQITDAAELEALVDRVIADNPRTVADYRGGKGKALGFLVGQVMRLTGGRANPDLLNRLLRERLAALRE